MSTKSIFSVEPFDNTPHCIVKYPDGTCDVMTLDEVRKNFDIPVTGGKGGHSDYEAALAYLAEKEDHVPGDFFSKSGLSGIERSNGKKSRQFSAEDPSLF